MAKQKKLVHRVQMTEEKRNIIHQLLEEYDIQIAEDIQDVQTATFRGQQGRISRPVRAILSGQF